VVLETSEQRKVERRGLDNELTDLALAFRTGRAVDDAETWLLCAVASREAAAEELQPGAHGEHHRAGVDGRTEPTLVESGRRQRLRRILAPTQHIDVAIAR
jgi:hypothetical protein